MGGSRAESKEAAVGYFPELVAPCAHGQFIISDVFVGVQPVRGRARRCHWAVRRNAVSGADLLRTRTAYALAICVRGGQHLTVERVSPQQAVEAIELLGHAPANRMRLPMFRMRLPVRLRCREGRFVIMPDRVLLRSRLPFARQPRWVVPRSALSGVSMRLLPGAGMLHDLTLHTIRGDAIRLERVRPDDALRVVTLLGYIDAEGAARADVRQASQFWPIQERGAVEDELHEPLGVRPRDAGRKRRSHRELEDLLEPART
jgi:hypothetical protein